MKNRQPFRKREFRRFIALLLSLVLVMVDTGMGSITAYAENSSIEAQSETPEIGEVEESAGAEASETSAAQDGGSEEQTEALVVEEKEKETEAAEQTEAPVVEEKETEEAEISAAEEKETEESEEAETSAAEEKETEAAEQTETSAAEEKETEAADEAETPVVEEKKAEEPKQTEVSEVEEKETEAPEQAETLAVEEGGEKERLSQSMTAAEKEAALKALIEQLIQDVYTLQGYFDIEDPAPEQLEEQETAAAEIAERYARYLEYIEEVDDEELRLPADDAVFLGMIFPSEQNNISLATNDVPKYAAFSITKINDNVYEVVSEALIKVTSSLKEAFAYALERSEDTVTINLSVTIDAADAAPVLGEEVVGKTLTLTGNYSNSEDCAFRYTGSGDLSIINMATLSFPGNSLYENTGTGTVTFTQSEDTDTGDCEVNVSSISLGAGDSFNVEAGQVRTGSDGLCTNDSASIKIEEGAELDANININLLTDGSTVSISGNLDTHRIDVLYNENDISDKSVVELNDVTAGHVDCSVACTIKITGDSTITGLSDDTCISIVEGILEVGTEGATGDKPSITGSSNHHPAIWESGNAVVKVKSGKVSNTGGLNVIDASGQSSVTVSGGEVTSARDSVISASGQSSVTVSGGEVTSAEHSAISASGQSSVTVSGGTVTSAGESAIYVGDTAAVEVNSGTVSNTGGGEAIAALGGSSITISGGTVTSKIAAAIMALDTVVKVNSGTVSNTGLSIAIAALGNSSIMISGGTVTSKLAPVVVIYGVSGKDNQRLTLTGGTIAAGTSSSAAGAIQVRLEAGFEDGTRLARVKTADYLDIYNNLAIISSDSTETIKVIYNDTAASAITDSTMTEILAYGYDPDSSLPSDVSKIEYYASKADIEDGGEPLHYEYVKNGSYISRLSIGDDGDITSKIESSKATQWKDAVIYVGKDTNDITGIRNDQGIVKCVATYEVTMTAVGPDDPDAAKDAVTQTTAVITGTVGAGSTATTKLTAEKVYYVKAGYDQGGIDLDPSLALSEKSRLIINKKKGGTDDWNERIGIAFVDEKGAYTISLIQLDPGTRYTYYLATENDNGDVSEVYEVSFTTKKAVPTADMFSVYVPKPLTYPVVKDVSGSVYGASVRPSDLDAGLTVGDITYRKYTVDEGKNRTYSGSYEKVPTGAGDWEMYADVTAADDSIYESVDGLYLRDVYVEPATMDRGWFSRYRSVSVYGAEVRFAESEPASPTGDIVLVPSRDWINKGVTPADYGTVTVMLYKDDEFNYKADKTDGKYNANDDDCLTYFIGVTASGSDNVASSGLIPIGEAIIEKVTTTLEAYELPETTVTYGEDVAARIAESVNKNDTQYAWENDVTYKFATSEDGNYYDWEDATGDIESWLPGDHDSFYVKAYFAGNTNYEACEKVVGKFTYDRINIVPFVSWCESKEYDGTKTVTDYELGFELQENANYTKDVKSAYSEAVGGGMKVGLNTDTGGIEWASAGAGTKEVDVFDMEITGGGGTYAKCFRLTTDRLRKTSAGKDKTDPDKKAQIYPITPKESDFEVSITAAGGLVHPVTVDKDAASGAAGVSITAKSTTIAGKASRVTSTGYKKKNLDTGIYEDELYGTPGGAGTWGVYICTDSKDYNNVAEFTDTADPLYIGDITVARANLDKGWFTVASSSVAYGTPVGFGAVASGEEGTSGESGSAITPNAAKTAAGITLEQYGGVKIHLYKNYVAAAATSDARLSGEVIPKASIYAVNLDENGSVQPYYIGITTDGSDDINPVDEDSPLYIGKLTVTRAGSTVTLNEVADVYYGTDVEEHVKASYGGKTGDPTVLVSEVKYLFSKAENGDGTASSDEWTDWKAWSAAGSEQVGKWKVKAVVEATDNYAKAESAERTFTVKKALVVPGIESIESKVYDGNTDATGTLGLRIAEGSSEGTRARFEADKAAGLAATGTIVWTSAEAGTETVNVTDIKIQEGYVGRYSLTAAQLDDVSAGGAKIESLPEDDEKDKGGDKDKTEDRDKGDDDSDSGSGSGSGSSGSGGSGGASGTSSAFPGTTGIITPAKGTASIVLSTGNPVVYASAVGGSAGGWIEDTKGRRYVMNSGREVVGSTTLNADGSVTENIAWLSVSGRFYAVGADGYVKDGWVRDSSTGEWYYCDSKDGIDAGWHRDSQDGHWYYLDPKTGKMLTGWRLIDGRWHYFSALPDAGTWYYDAAAEKWVYNTASTAYPMGALYVSTSTPDGYIVDADGVWTK